MKNPAIKATRHIVLIVIAIAGLLMPIAVHAAERKVGRAQQWKVKESNQRLTISGKYLFCKTTEGEMEIIPLATITSLEKETLIRKPVKKAMRDLKKDYTVDWNDVGEAIGADPRLAMLVPAMPVLAPLTALTKQAILAPFRGVKINHHFVHITWRERGEEESRMFRLSSRDADSLLAELQSLTGKAPSKIDVLEEIEKGSGTMMVFKVNTHISIASTHLPAGNYRILLVERSADAGVLYVLRRGSLEPGDILAIVAAKISPVVDPQIPIARFEQDLLGEPQLVGLKFGSRYLQLSVASAGH